MARKDKKDTTPIFMHLGKETSAVREVEKAIKRAKGKKPSDKVTIYAGDNIAKAKRSLPKRAPKRLRTIYSHNAHNAFSPVYGGKGTHRAVYAMNGNWKLEVYSMVSEKGKTPIVWRWCEYACKHGEKNEILEVLYRRDPLGDGVSHTEPTKAHDLSAASEPDLSRWTDGEWIDTESDKAQVEAIETYHEYGVSWQ